ncbi:hypothetical protein ACIPZF_17005 [Pseudomonas sp. NPDC089752]|uniref:hypothetical protein n=1 Tax=Pseudomonas sp. NPDC089752 TaxID=3364472 RepID=UPI003824BC76
MARSVARLGFASGCTLFERRCASQRTKAVHLFDAGDWPILSCSHNSLFSSGLTELARFLQRPVRAMH